MESQQPGEKFLALPFLRKSVRSISRKRDTQGDRINRLYGIGWLPNSARNHLVAWIGEFVGTFMFLFFAFSGTQVANTQLNNEEAHDTEVAQAPNTSVLLYISLSFGFSLAVNAWVFFRISGGLFNPAVSLGLCLIGAVPWVRGAVVSTAQIIGGIASAGIVSALFPGPLAVRTSLGGGTSVTRGLFIEMFLTFGLVFTIIMLAAEKHKGTFLAPVGIGLALFIAELSGVYFTGGSLNPARSFGPCVIDHSFHGYHWLYWVGPMLGAILAAVFYRLIKTLEYETANPGQDHDDKEHEMFTDDNVASASRVRRSMLTERDGDYVSDSNSTFTPSRQGTSNLRPGSANNGTTAGVQSPRGKRGRSSMDTPATGAQMNAVQEDTDTTYHDGPDAESGTLPKRT